MRARPILLRAVLVVLGTAAGLAVFEVWARFKRLNEHLEAALGPSREWVPISMWSEPWTKYDPLLGWAPKPGGRGPGLVINEQGYRGPAVPVPKPAGVRRVVVVGDSNAFGLGANDGDTFSARLGRLLGPGWDVANLGVEGYGIDQALLRLERDGFALRPDAVVFTLITDDLHRATNVVWAGGYGRPHFVMVEGKAEPVLTNVPVPPPVETGRTYTRASISAREAAKVVFGLHPASFEELSRFTGAGARGDDAGGLYAGIFRRLGRVCREKGVPVVVLHLPEDAHWSGDPKPDLSQMARLAAAGGVRTFDVFSELTARPLKDVYWNRHPNAKGHEIVARRLKREMATLLSSKP